MLLTEIKQELVSRSDLKKLESQLDAMFKKIGIDIEWTKHFHDRMNDERNKELVTIEEVKKLFHEVFKKHAKEIKKQGPDFEGVLNDISTKLNIPFVLKWDRDNEELDLVSKTVMRKQNFKTSDKKFTVKS